MSFEYKLTWDGDGVSSPDRGGPPQSDVVKASQLARDAAMPMGWTSENVAEEFDISREEMDEFAALSFQRAENADKEGIFTSEIVPFTAYVNDPATGQRTTKVITKDDGIRYGTTKEGLMRVKAAFPQWGKGQTTGGNASQITDGVAAVLLMTRRKAEQLGMKILAKHVTTSVAGLAPRIMGIGPSIAIPMVLEATGLTKDDVDLFEVRSSRLLSPWSGFNSHCRSTRRSRRCTFTASGSWALTSTKSTYTAVQLRSATH